MYAYNMVILNAFPLLTVDKKLSLEVTSKLERLEYSYKHCTDEDGTMVVYEYVRRVYLCVFILGALRLDSLTHEVHPTKRYDFKFTAIS